MLRVDRRSAAFKDDFFSTFPTRLRENDVFVDVGANCGAYSLFAARNVGPNGRVIAIEPMPEMLKRLRYNIAVNGFRNIEVVPTAVGPEAGTATLFVDEARRGLSSMEKLEGTTPLQVPVATLLSVVNAPASIASMR